MKTLLKKELTLSASPLSFVFIAFALMALIPNYPILVGGFFVCLGIFQSFMAAREAGDTLFTAMLPVKKTDVVKARFAFTVFIQLAAFAAMAALTALRMTALADAGAYTANALMNANLAYLGWELVVFALFNALFVCAFYKTAYKLGWPFVIFGIVSFLVITAAEVLHHIPGLEGLNSTHYEPKQLAVLIAGAVIYGAVTFISERVSEKRFSRVDL